MHAWARVIPSAGMCASVLHAACGVLLNQHPPLVHHTSFRSNQYGPPHPQHPPHCITPATASTTASSRVCDEVVELKAGCTSQQEGRLDRLDRLY